MTLSSIEVGDVRVTVVCEGFAPIPISGELPGQDVDWAAERAAHPWAFLDGSTGSWHVHAFALETAEGLVMVDTGIGEYPPIAPWGEAPDRDAAWAAAGVDVGSVRAVVHTHLHADHAGGSVVAGRPRFPNAIHHVHPADWAFFGRPDRVQGYTARGPMGELERLGMVDLTESDREVWPGIRVVHAPGHTPGHRVVVLERGDDTLVLSGDLLHVPGQIARPDSRSSHDVDADEGRRSRVRVLADARTRGWTVAVSHFPNPFGTIREAGWVAVR